MEIEDNYVPPKRVIGFYGESPDHYSEYLYLRLVPYGNDPEETTDEEILGHLTLVDYTGHPVEDGRVLTFVTQKDHNYSLHAAIAPALTREAQVTTDPKVCGGLLLHQIPDFKQELMRAMFR